VLVQKRKSLGVAGDIEGCHDRADRIVYGTTKVLQDLEGAIVSLFLHPQFHIPDVFGEDTVCSNIPCD
jgi:hypothetical protein